MRWGLAATLNGSRAVVRQAGTFTSGVSDRALDIASQRRLLSPAAILAQMKRKPSRRYTRIGAILSLTGPQAAPYG